jgi:hypothetical protein
VPPPAAIEEPAYEPARNISEIDGAAGNRPSEIEAPRGNQPSEIPNNNISEIEDPPEPPSDPISEMDQ